MPLVYAVNPWTRLVGSWAIKHAVSRSRAAVRWRHYAKKLGRAYAAVFGGTAAAASAAYMVAPDVRHYMRGRGRRRETGNSFRPRAKKRKADGNPGYETNVNNNQLDNIGWNVVGKFSTKGERLAKMMLSQIRTVTDRWQLLAAPDATQQSLNLDYALDQTVNTTTMSLPFYMWDLTCLESIRDKNANQYPRVCWRMIREGSGTSYTYNMSFVNQRNAADANSLCTWQTEKPVQSPDESYLRRRYLKDASIKMLIMGATHRPARVTVELWQFTDETLCPPAAWSTDALGTTTNYYEPTPANLGGADQQKWNTFWLQETDNLYGNPLVTRGTSSSLVSGVNKLFSRTFEFQPEENSDNDTRGRQIQFGLKYGIDKVGTYIRYPYVATANTSYEDEDVYDAETANVERLPVVSKLGRVFLVVKAKVFNEGSSAQDCPSFDIMIRRKTQMLEGWAGPDI